jgi:hypothetical protein
MESAQEDVQPLPVELRVRRIGGLLRCPFHDPDVDGAGGVKARSR